MINDISPWTATTPNTFPISSSLTFWNKILLLKWLNVNMEKKVWFLLTHLWYERPEKRISHSRSKTETGRQEDDGEVVTHGKEGHSSNVRDQGYHGYNLILQLREKLF